MVRYHYGRLPAAPSSKKLYVKRRRSRMVNLTNACLSYSLFVNAFRVSVYLIAPEKVASVKIDKDAWKDSRVREAVLAWTQMILTFMSFRAVICLWAVFLPDSGNKRYLCSIMFVYDLFIFSRLLQKKSAHKKDTIMVHEMDAWPPFLIQLSLVLIGFIFHVCWLVLKI
jgi:hypothetical protein